MRAIQAAISVAAAGAALALTLTGCTGSTTTIIERTGGSAGPSSPGPSSPGPSSSGAASAPASPAVKPSPAGAAVAITPGNAVAADPSKGITVTASGGTLTSVKVDTLGDAVGGSYAAGRTSWHSAWTLNVDTTYTVTATAVAKNGVKTTRTSSFRTVQPADTFSTVIFEGYRQTYGVGMPIILEFSHPITNKKAVEQAIVLQTSKPVTGAWYWDNDETLDFRPRSYWPAHINVSFTGHFDGIQGASGVWGYHTLTQSFKIGASVIAVASTRTHKTQIYVDGKLKYNWDISSGKPGDDTPDGTYLTIDKGNPVRMTGPGYNLLVPWSVRFTWSGDYYHDAYWSVNEQGFENVSHGCVNLSPANAETYYKLAVPGDPITIKGSPRPGTFDNGWTEWFLTWAQLLRGSATGMAVKANAAGSTFVSPKALAPAKASYPITTGEPGNDLE